MNAIANQSILQSRTPHKGLKILLIVVLVLGIFFRFVNLDRKVYWYDEAFTLLRVSGYTEQELYQQEYDGRIIGVEDLQSYQHLNPDKTLGDTVESLATEAPNHVPLYFVAARVWLQVFGDSVGAIRSLSAVLSVLALPCLYWLCCELFQSPFVGWMAMALFAISPFQVLYAQEARPYSLLAAAIFLSGAALLRSLRLNTRSSWAMYAASLIFGIYSHLLFLFVAIGHGLYIVVLERFRLTRRVIAYGLASTIGAVAFIPWLLVVSANAKTFKRIVSWASDGNNLLFSLIRSLGSLSRTFLDLNVDSQVPSGLLIPASFIILVLLLFMSYSLYFVFRHTPEKVWLFIFTLIGITALFTFLQDAIQGGARLTIPRYLFTCYVGIQLPAAYLLATRLISVPKQTWQQQGWQWVAIAIFSCGVLSCTVSSQAQFWWHKGFKEFPPMVSAINQSNNPLLIADRRRAYMLSLSYLLDPEVKLQLVTVPSIAPVPSGFSDVFLCNPSDKLLEQFKQSQKYAIEPVSTLGKFKEKLWYLEEKQVSSSREQFPSKRCDFRGCLTKV